METIPQALIDQIMVKCARRCCICRRLRPTKLQVHHIILKSDGGTDDEDNLIVTCISCHSDVHSIVPFTRRFSTNELKGHRDALINMVAEGKIIDNETDNTNQIIDRVISKIVVEKRVPKELGLSPEAVKLLLAAALATGVRQGMITVVNKRGCSLISPGNQDSLYEIGDRRGEAKYKAALEELQNNNLIEYSSEVIREVTNLGYLLADEIASSQGQSSNQ